MDKKTGTVITIVGAVVAMCLCLGCVGTGIGLSLSTDDNTFQPLGLILLCPALLIWALPVLLWVFLVRGKEDGLDVD